MLQAHCDWYADESFRPGWREDKGICFFVMRGDDGGEKPDTFLWDGTWHRLPPEEADRLWVHVREMEKELWAKECAGDHVFWIDLVALAWFNGHPWEEK